MKFVKFIQKNLIVFSIYFLLIIIAITFYGFIIRLSLAKSVAHFLDLIRQVAPLSLISLGQTLVLLVGGIDLSVGAIASLANILSANFMKGEVSLIPISVFLTLAICIIIGFINGIVIVKAKMPPFLVTLAMSSVIRGAYLLYTGGAPRGGIAKEFRVIARKWIGSPVGNAPGIFPVAGIIWIMVFLILLFAINKTIFGIELYAVGGNPRTAWLSGYNPDKFKIMIYIFSATFAALSGLMHSALIGGALLHVGDPYLLDSIAATCMGGTTFDGGVGGIVGTIAGVLIIQLLNAFMTIMGIKEAGKYILLGLLIITILTINNFISTSKR
jgi:ribose/xylose/arabinose/galactoside ABC-type transport system permease subunit